MAGVGGGGGGGSSGVFGRATLTSALTGADAPPSVTISFIDPPVMAPIITPAKTPPPATKCKKPKKKKKK